ncbi:hypothetical protein DLAC_04337 [Tieghemostelium lacteum]|uniref:Uncharacterized protein n=1 Tax=Tieghemostelium lacteum TaxID=361077 RepID=A0A151ZJ92_TIELA|nr:hypothetical protein DLAC_04337 [Tieghemostelium lacteum]|eukprot:KYQ94062.1 hypothetical protein DLAC_04337 [Tieghemostelium lacteum]
MILGAYSLLGNIIRKSYEYYSEGSSKSLGISTERSLVSSSESNNGLYGTSGVIPHFIIKKILNYVMYHINGCDHLISILKDYTLVCHDWNRYIVPKLQCPRLFVDEFFFKKLRGIIECRKVDLRDLIFYREQQSQEQSLLGIQSIFPIEFLFYKTWNHFEHENLHQKISRSFPHTKRLILYIDFEMFPTEQQQQEQQQQQQRSMLSNMNSQVDEVPIEHMTLSLQAAIPNQVFKNIFCLPNLKQLVIIGLPLMDMELVDDTFDKIFQSLVKLEKLVLKNARFPSRIISNLIRSHPTLSYLYVSLYWSDSDQSQYQIIKELTLNKRISTFISDCCIRFGDLVQLLNTNKTLTNLKIENSNIVGTESDFSGHSQTLISNQTLKTFGLNSSLLNLKWEPSPTMVSLKISDSHFSYQFQNLVDLHFITAVDNYEPLFTQFLIPLLMSSGCKLRLAIIEIHAPVLESFSLDAFEEALFVNQSLETLCIRGLKVTKEFLYEMLDFHHPTLTRLECHTGEINDFLVLRDLVAQNSNLKSLHIVLTLPFDRFLDFDENIAHIIEKNDCLVNLSIDVTHGFVESNQTIQQSHEKLYQAIKNNHNILSLQFPRLLHNPKIQQLLNHKLIGGYYSPIKSKIEK